MIASTQATNNSFADISFQSTSCRNESVVTMQSQTDNPTCLGLEHDLLKNELVLGNITGDTALVSQQVINKEEVLRDSVDAVHLPNESIELKIGKSKNNKKRKPKIQSIQSCKRNKDIVKPV